MDTFEQFKLAKTAEGFDEVLTRPMAPLCGLPG